MTTVACSWFPACSGCDAIGEPLETQLRRKTAHLEGLLRAAGLEDFPTPRAMQPGPAGLRDRLDFSLQDGRLGLFHREKRKIVDLADCAQLSPALADWLRDFRRRLPPVARASIRLRVSPAGQRGMWLDLANLDAKALLDESTWLNSWPADVAVEMGQRRKTVARNPGTRPVLIDPVLRPWFESRWRAETVPLFGTVGGFTQPSLVANRLINAWFQERVLALAPKRILEFGAGQGNLSFAALSGEATLTACEFDRPALEGFQRSLEELAARGIDLRPRVKLDAGDFLRRPSEELRHADLLIANPPRSGLKAFLDPLPQAQELRHLLYMSCHPESFVEDIPRLRQAGFHLERLDLLDQFPQTRHLEILTHWRR